jgi:hypothetical protein
MPLSLFESAYIRTRSAIGEADWCCMTGPTQTAPQDFECSLGGKSTPPPRRSNWLRPCAALRCVPHRRGVWHYSGSMPGATHEHRSRPGNYMFGTKVNINVWNLRRTAALKWPWIITMDTIRPDDPPEPLSEHPRGVGPQRSAFCRTRVQSGCFQEIAQW